MSAGDFTFEGISAPHFTQTPDELIDHAMAHMSGNEFKILMYVVRRTFGFKQPSAKISVQQLMTGLKGHDSGTGIKRRASVIGYVRKLRRNGYLVGEVSRGRTMTLRLRERGEPIDTEDLTCTENVHPPPSGRDTFETSTSSTFETSTGTVLKLPLIIDKQRHTEDIQGEDEGCTDSKSAQPPEKKPRATGWTAQWGDESLKYFPRDRRNLYGELGKHCEQVRAQLEKRESGLAFRCWQFFHENVEPKYFSARNFARNPLRWKPPADWKPTGRNRHMANAQDGPTTDELARMSPTERFIAENRHKYELGASDA